MSPYWKSGSIHTTNFPRDRPNSVPSTQIRELICVCRTHIGGERSDHFGRSFLSTRGADIATLGHGGVGHAPVADGAPGAGFANDPSTVRAAQTRARRDCRREVRPSTASADRSGSARARRRGLDRDYAEVRAACSRQAPTDDTDDSTDPSATASTGTALAGGGRPVPPRARAIAHRRTRSRTGDYECLLGAQSSLDRSPSDVLTARGPTLSTPRARRRHGKCRARVGRPHGDGEVRSFRLRFVQRERWIPRGDGRKRSSRCRRPPYRSRSGESRTPDKSHVAISKLVTSEVEAVALNAYAS